METGERRGAPPPSREGGFVDRSIMRVLVDMGIGKDLAEQACQASNNISIAAAMQWALNHVAEKMKAVGCEPPELPPSSARDPVRSIHSSGRQLQLPRTAGGSRSQEIPSQSNARQPSANVFRESPVRKEITFLPHRAAILKGPNSNALVLMLKDTLLAHRPPPKERLPSAASEHTTLSQTSQPKAHADNSYHHPLVTSRERPPLRSDGGGDGLSSTALAEMRNLRAELAQMRSELRGKTHPTVVKHPYARKRPGMLYQNLFVSIGHVD